MRFSVLSTCVFALASVAAPLHVADADTLLVERAATSSSGIGPKRGQPMDTVLRNLGEPAQRVGPVGGDLPQHPPITRWVYPQFTVYFEGSLVISSVANRATAQESGPKPAQ